MTPPTNPTGWLIAPPRLQPPPIRRFFTLALHVVEFVRLSVIGKLTETKGQGIKISGYIIWIYKIRRSYVGRDEFRLVEASGAEKKLGLL